jgi:hypothetical protein
MASGRFLLRGDTVADIFYTDAPTIEGTPYPWPAAEPTRRKQGLRNWHKFVLTYGLVMAGAAVLLYREALHQGANELTAQVITAAALAVWLLTALVILAIAWRKGRL